MAGADASRHTHNLERLHRSVKAPSWGAYLPAELYFYRNLSEMSRGFFEIPKKNLR